MAMPIFQDDFGHAAERHATYISLVHCGRRGVSSVGRLLTEAKFYPLLRKFQPLITALVLPFESLVSHSHSTQSPRAASAPRRGYHESWPRSAQASRAALVMRVGRVKERFPPAPASPQSFPHFLSIFARPPASQGCRRYAAFDELKS